MRTDRLWERQSSSFLPRLGFLGAIGVLALTTACVSGTVAEGSDKHTSGAPQGGASAGGEQPGTDAKAGNGTTDPGVPAAAAPTALPAEKACTTAGSPGPRVLRRLTAGEFAASIADLFGDKAAPVGQVFNDSRVLGFTVDSNTLRVQDLNADQLMTNAEAVASWAVSAKLTQLTQLATCSTLDDQCAKLFIKNFGRKAFRTAIPDGDARLGSYSKLFMSEANFADAAASVISAMLQSPYFLYRSEIGAGAATGGERGASLRMRSRAACLTYSRAARPTTRC
ncbi:MAG: DUF1595 domain-containing protein [Pseudomonadota bacterium]